jgi:phage protein D
MPDQAGLLSHFYLKIGGQNARDDLTASIATVTVESSLHMPDVATITLLDPATKWADSDDLAPGKEIELSARAEGSEQPLFDGEIVEIELAWEQGMQKVVVRAFDRLHRLARGCHVRSFQNMTDGDLIQKLAQEVGLRAQVGPTAEVHPYALQANESNLVFLQRRAAALGYLLYVEKKILHCEAPESQRQPIEIKWGTDLSEFRPRMTTIGQISEFRSRGWDPAQRREVIGQAKDSTIVPHIGNGKSGGKLADEAFHIPTTKYLVADRPIRTQAFADILAQAAADRHAGQFVEAEGVCAGNPGIVAGALVKIDNIGKRFGGTYFVTGAIHMFKPGEYTTRFNVSGLQPATLLSLLMPEEDVNIAGALVIGVVTDNQDPEGLGRVKVKYPWLSAEHASDWARLVIVGGGDKRGVEFVPEVNDEVLIGFELGDIHYPYVLGGLWNGKDVPPRKSGELVSGGKVQQRIIRSRTGHMITLDDGDGGGGVTIEDKNGNIIKLDSGANSLTIEVKGDATLKAQGNLNLEATGQVTVKGSIINLN